MAPDTKLSQHSPKLPVMCVALLHIGEVGWHGAHKPTWAPHNNARAQVAKWAGKVSLGSTKAGGVPVIEATGCMKSRSNSIKLHYNLVYAITRRCSPLCRWMSCFCQGHWHSGHGHWHGGHSHVLSGGHIS